MRRILFVPLLLSLVSCASLSTYFSDLMKDPLDRPAEELLKMADESCAGKLYEQCREYLDAARSRDVERKYYARIQLKKADSYFSAGMYPEALVEYRAFLEFHMYHEDAPYAQFRVAQSYFNQIRSVDRGYENIFRAREEFNLLLKRYPRNPYRELALSRIDQCANLLAEYEDYVATFYYNKGSYPAAIKRFEALLATYPGSLGEMDILLKLGRSYLEVGEKEKAGSTFRSIIEKYPSSKQAAEAKSLLEKL